MSPRRAWAGGLVALALVVGGCGGSGGGAPKDSAARTPVTVSISDFKFMPKSITVAAGTKVTWINEDSAPHTATSGDHKSFDTGTLNKGQSKTLTLMKAGTYSYVCQFHPFMTATVVVR